MVKRYICRGILLIAIVCGLINVRAVYGATAGNVVVEKLARSADLILVGKCLTSYSAWNGANTEICTYSLIDPLRIIKGVSDKPFLVETLGGQVGSLVSTVIGSPKFVDEQDYLLFLSIKSNGQLGVVGLNKGKFNVYEKGGNKIAVNLNAGDIIFPSGVEGLSGKSHDGNRVDLVKFIDLIERLPRQGAEGDF